jgi:hypothetical protein
MTDFGTMLNAYPAALVHVDADLLVLCVEECLNCAQTATACADACLADSERADLTQCVGIAANCADVAAATARVVSRRTGFDAKLTEAVLQACVEACRACYDECRRHALDHEYCRICGLACERCAHACRKVLTALR